MGIVCCRWRLLVDRISITVDMLQQGRMCLECLLHFGVGMRSLLWGRCTRILLC